MEQTTCRGRDCDRPRYARGMCFAHYLREWSTGKANLDKPIRETRSRLTRAQLVAELGNPPAGARWCRTCRQAKPEDAFHDAARMECVRCKNDARNRRYREQPDVRSARLQVERKRYERNRDKVREYRREYHKNNRHVAIMAREVRRARKLNAEVERFSPDEIFNRDGWRCGLCGEAIPDDVTHPHPKSVSLDHIVPLSRGGGHTRANVQAAHLRCNLKKSASGGGQLRLIG